MKTEYQYYYKRNECPAKEATDSNCICWHDEGTGPYDNTRHDDEAQFLEWRAKPSNAKITGGDSRPVD